MEGRTAHRLELAVDVLASAILAAAVALVSLRLGMPPLAAGAVALLILLAGLKGLAAIGSGLPSFKLVEFQPAEFPEATLPDELLLTDADRLLALPSAGSEEPLVLDDILANLDSGSRVVRLFDRAAMPTPGQLQVRIDRHLADSEPPLLSADASQALHDALAELRRTLR
jgi:hypothetical protein